MKRFNRTDRLSEEILREVSTALREDLKDPGIAGIVSVVKVTLSKDLRHANIFVSVYGDDDKRKKTLEALIRGAGFLRSLIGKRMRIRSSPELSFTLDNSIEHSVRIGKLLNKIMPNDADVVTNKEDDIGS
ncbi:MAG TPA: 30S ribosome-binding factor RbfA [Nitrospinota bacterium]|nr:30S ribosome-binding factor RbfA [Nitrospinota bacterium]|tara:strand:- start:21909 stop:22301 length:393 start_codon:yes stop_codon:yes gene_type:complete